MQKLILCLLLTSLAPVLVAQKLNAESGTIKFFSRASIEDIDATNKKVQSIFDVATGDIAFVVPIQSFEFPKKLMQQHFNEKYLESEKYPKATFNGKVSDYDPSGAGKQSVMATGKLTIHGETQEITVPGTLEKKDGKLLLKTSFIVRLIDYEIKIPQVLWQNVAEQVEVTTDITYKSP